MLHAHEVQTIAASSEMSPRRTWKLRSAAAALLAALTVAGCGADVNAGYVIDREYHESYVYYTSNCTSYDSQGACVSTMQVPHIQPERFTIKVEDCTLEHDSGDDCPSENHTVPESTYEQATVGKYWSEDGGVVSR